MIKSMMSQLQIDKHIAYSLFLRLWSIIAGAIVVILIPHSLTKAEQGFYFTFSSLLSAQVFFELGLNTVLVQIIGHEMAYLNFSDNNTLMGDKKHLARAQSLFKMVKKIYVMMSIIFFIFATVAGIIFFKDSKNNSVFDWIYIWPILSFLSSVNLYLSPFLSMLEGMGLVSRVSKLRLVQSVIGYVFLVSSLGIFRCGLKSMVAIPFFGAVISSVWIFKNYRELFFGFKLTIHNQISWIQEIFPFQWKIAVSWLSGYFIFQIFNPVIFKKFGAESAGEIGLALTIFSTIGSLSYSWFNAKVPSMVQLIALNDTLNLKKLFWSVFTRSATLNLLSCAAFVSMVQISRYYHFSIADRIAELPILILLSIVSFGNHFIFSAASFMRAHKVEPMLYNSVVVAILCIFGIYILSEYSVLMIILGYAVVTIFVSLPWTIYLFQKFYYKGQNAVI